MAKVVVVMRGRFSMDVIGVDTDHIDRSEPHAAFGDHSVCQPSNRDGRSPKQNGLERCVVVERHVRGRYDETVVGVLEIEQSLGERARPVIVNVAQTRYAVALRGSLLPGAIHEFADEVAHRFRSTGIRPFAHDGVEASGKIVVERDGDTLHSEILRTSPAVTSHMHLPIN